MDKFQDKTIFTNFAKLTEQTGGTGADLHTTALKDENGNYVLNGEKWLISHTDCSQYAYVIAVTDPQKQGDERLSAFFVPMDTPGFELVPMPHMMGCRGAGHAGFKMTDVVLDPKYLLGEEGQGMKAAMHSLAISRVHIADSNLGMAQRMLEMSIARARDRVTFGKPIIQRQAIKMKLANMATNIHALRCMVMDFADDYDKDPHNEFVDEKAAMCKLFSIDTVKMVSDEMLEIFGGDGYFEDSPYGPTERLYRDCRAMWLEEGVSHRAAHHHRARRGQARRPRGVRRLDRRHGPLGRFRISLPAFPLAPRTASASRRGRSRARPFATEKNCFLRDARRSLIVTYRASIEEIVPLVLTVGNGGRRIACEGVSWPQRP